MQSVIILSNDNAKIANEIKKIAEAYAVHSFDQTIFTPVGKDTSRSSSIGISEIRNFQKTLLLKPLKSQKKLAIMHNAENLTPEAQNALLKTLEEPPDNTIIVLSTPRLESILPTVCSRCTILDLMDKMPQVEESVEKFTLLLSEIHSSSVSKRLQIAQDFAKSKDEALVTLEQLLFSAQKTLRERPFEKNSKHAIHLLQEFHTLIKSTNTNLRLSMEELVLQL